ncbi:MAG: hypothetical protein SOV61_02835 [Lachnospiraceae bacterium]|nr:hypothetical protein [Lachnospiraceae bacterium]
MREYPTDEELELFIRQIEQQELYAPKYMKEQILNKAFPKQSGEKLDEKGSQDATVYSLAYRLKIVAGMAAAVLMLILLPVQSADRGYEEPVFFNTKTNVNSVINGRTREWNGKINSWFQWIGNIDLGFIFEKENDDNGGIENEN